MFRLLASVRKRIRTAMIGAAAATMVLGNVASVHAAVLTASSLELSDPQSSALNVTYTWNAASFTTATTIQCVQLEFDTQADGGGGKPAGMDLTGSSLSSNTVQASLTAEVIDDANGVLEYTDGTGGTPSASGAVIVDGIDNPTTEGSTFFMLAVTYTDAACTGGNEVDTSVIAWTLKDGEPVTLTIDPTLTFACSSVAAALGVNGATTTHQSAASGIDYNDPVDVTSSANGISAHDLDVTTNASSGYVIYVRHAQTLQNDAADVIGAHAGTNAAPSSFTGAGTESWGYTTEDGTLTGGTADRFTTAGGDLWAGFPLGNEVIADNTVATPGSGDTTRVGHQVGVAADTPAGTYTTTIVYTIVATY